jgi:hypothetical protein
VLHDLAVRFAHALVRRVDLRPAFTTLQESLSHSPEAAMHFLSLPNPLASLTRILLAYERRRGGGAHPSGTFPGANAMAMPSACGVNDTAQSAQPTLAEHAKIGASKAARDCRDLDMLGLTCQDALAKLDRDDLTFLSLTSEGATRIPEPHERRLATKRDTKS